MSNSPSMFSLKELFSNGDKYLVPVYQRNYTWEKFHLQQLVQDIWDSCSNTPDRNYYIGTLVVYKTSGGLYETIDGQQRLTTINIMLCALRNEIEKKNGSFTWFRGVNLAYQLREKASSSLQRLYEHLDPSIEDAYIKQMYDAVKPTIEAVIGCSSSEDTQEFSSRYERFRQYFLNNVIITRVLLPSDTDLNHYFEIMNTRGEQLEKHEILKARMLNALKDNPKASWLANRIWEACSDMDCYVQMGITDTRLRQLIFSNDMNTLTAPDFDTLVETVQQYSRKEKSFSIIDITGAYADINQIADSIEGDANPGNDESRFSSVINFPNFLLHVLRVLRRTDIPLDDKRLLNTFPKEIDTAFAKRFIYQLLKLRFLFDRYIIKRDFVDNKEVGKWNILKVEVQEKGYSYNNTYGEEQKRNIMIQAMFHVSLPSQNYKHWLCAALLYLSDHNDGHGLYDYLNRLSHAYMLDRFIQPGNKQSDYYKIIFENSGKPHNKCPDKLLLPRFDTNIDVFYFNYLDMQLWLKGECREFVFTSRSSVEHFYPQHPMENYRPMDEEHLHSFGNLCLISSSKNSKLSNFSPIQKTDFYAKSQIDSIKQKLMMDRCREKRNWDISDIEEHAQEMERVIVESLKDFASL
ncbi:MAG: DUF262 domain-containing protein [Candidatus Egerieousia sp.]